MCCTYSNSVDERKHLSIQKIIFCKKSNTHKKAGQKPGILVKMKFFIYKVVIIICK